MPTIVWENDYGYGGNYYNLLPKGNETFPTLRIKNSEEYFSRKVTPKDRKILQNVVKNLSIKRTHIADACRISVGAVTNIIYGNSSISFGRSAFTRVATYLKVEDKMHCLK